MAQRHITRVTIVFISCLHFGLGFLLYYTPTLVPSLQGRESSPSPVSKAVLTKAKDSRECCWKVRLAFTEGHSNGAFLLHPYIFNYFTMEPGTVNGKNHYITEDGRFVIAFCGESWWVQSADIRGECKGWAHSGWETNECVHDIDYTWRYFIPSISEFIDAQKGISVWCKS